MSPPDWHESLRNDPRTIEELVQCALTEVEDELDRVAVCVLHFRSTREVLDTASTLSVSSVALERQLGAEILGQFGCFEVEPFPCFDETVERLLAMLNGEEDPGVLNAIGLGLRHDPRCVLSLSKWKNHSHGDVRFGVVLGLSGQTDPISIQTLIELTRDPVSIVRDWATFSLGQQCDLDTPDIREALWQRTEDEDETTRLEGLAGLAKRGDERIIPQLIHQFSQQEVARLVIEAAGNLGSPQLLDELLQLKADYHSNAEYTQIIQSAISCCRK